jgi:hypothetical protein
MGGIDRPCRLISQPKLEDDDVELEDVGIKAP